MGASLFDEMVAIMEYPTKDSNQRNRIIKLLQNGEKVKRIRNIEHVSNWAIYRIINETSVRAKRGYVKNSGTKKFQKHSNVAIMEEAPKSNFVCLGIGYCGTCKRMFQYPCLLGYDS